MYNISATLIFIQANITRSQRSEILAIVGSKIFGVCGIVAEKLIIDWQLVANLVAKLVDKFSKIILDKFPKKIYWQIKLAKIKNILLYRGLRNIAKLVEATRQSVMWGTRWTQGQRTWWSPSSSARHLSTFTCCLRTKKNLTWTSGCLILRRIPFRCTQTSPVSTRYLID